MKNLIWFIFHVPNISLYFLYQYHNDKFWCIQVLDFFKKGSTFFKTFINCVQNKYVRKTASYEKSHLVYFLCPKHFFFFLYQYHYDKF